MNGWPAEVSVRYFAGGNPGSQEKEAGFTRCQARLSTDKVEVQDLGNNFASGEPGFVPRNAQSSEDDGWVLAVWYDEERNLSEMIVLDARNFAGAPIVR